MSGQLIREEDLSFAIDRTVGRSRQPSGASCYILIDRLGKVEARKKRVGTANNLHPDRDTLSQS